MTNDLAKLYDPGFFNEHLQGGLRSASLVGRHVLQLFPHIKSVVDVGCGVGPWLKAFQDLGVAKVHGIDGDHVAISQLAFPKECFEAQDFSRGIHVGGSYDLSVCLEVGEHLPAASAFSLVETLTSAAPIVLFSAAVPGQGGPGHVNEQFSAYWEALFLKRGYVKADLIRKRIWQDPSVEFWYRQNLFLYLSPSVLDRYASVKEEYLSSRDHRMLMFHEATFRHYTSLSWLLGQLPGALSRALANRWARYFG